MKEKRQPVRRRSVIEILYYTDEPPAVQQTPRGIAWDDTASGTEVDLLFLVQSISAFLGITAAPDRGARGRSELMRRQSEVRVARIESFVWEDPAENGERGAGTEADSWLSLLRYLRFRSTQAIHSWLPFRKAPCPSVSCSQTTMP